jgi:hypothetical protein
VILRQLCDPVGQVRHADLLAALLQDVVETAEIEGGQILAVRIARPVLDGARDADHAFDAAVVRRDFPVLERPVDTRARERPRLKVDVAHARGGPPQKLVLPPTAKQRGHIHWVPGAVVNGISCSRRPRPTRLSM